MSFNNDNHIMLSCYCRFPDYLKTHGVGAKILQAVETAQLCL